jgi:hypothetical protein
VTKHDSDRFIGLNDLDIRINENEGAIVCISEGSE